MDQKKIILAVVLCIGILFVWQKLFPPPVPPPERHPSAAETASKSAADTGAAKGAANPTATAAPGDANAAAATAGGAQAAFPPRETVIDTPDERFVFTNQGAALKSARLRDAKYLQTPGDPQSGVEVLKSGDPRYNAFRVDFDTKAFPTPPDSSWRLIEGTPEGQVVYRAELPTVAIEKRFVVDKTRYRIHLDVTVENRSPAPQDHHLQIHVAAHQDPSAKGGFLSGAASNTSSLMCHDAEKVHREHIDGLEKSPLKQAGGIRWLGADEKFFLVAVVPYPETPPRDRACGGKAAGDGWGEGTLSFAERQVAPGQRTTYSFATYVGPKVIADLEAVRPAGEDADLASAVDVSLAFISRPLLYLLKFFHGFVGNWGLAIILLTVFIKLVTFYPTQRSLLSAKKMQKLGPKMAAIRKKYENDRQRQSQETMNLYKAHGVSPFGGCLPSLIQMPIWIALYSTLNYAVELYRSPFIFHIHDLTAKDPYYITPLVMGGVMFVQMKMSPTSPDSQQQKMMALMMPVMFTAFSLVLPSGLAVYMLTSYLIGILQQLWINHQDRKSHGTAKA